MNTPVGEKGYRSGKTLSKCSRLKAVFESSILSKCFMSCFGLSCERTRPHPQTAFGECPGSQSTSGRMCSDGDRQGFTESHQRCSKVGTRRCNSDTQMLQKSVQHDMAPEHTRAASNPQSHKSARSVRLIHPPKCTMSFNFVASRQAAKKWVWYDVYYVVKTGSMKHETS